MTTPTVQILIEPLRALVSRGLLEGIHGKLRAETIVIRDLEPALFYAGRRFDPARRMDLSYCDWYALREDEQSASSRALRKNVNEIPYRECWEALQPLQILACDSLAHRGFPDAGEEAFTDVYLMGSNMIMGDIRAIGRVLYEAYSAGGWPCGWSGQFPEGHLIVYWPYTQAPEFKD